MCGIVGIWVDHGSKERILHEMEGAVARLHHRGPDDRGIWFGNSGLALGHTRLSIIDLSPLGHQPMVSADSRHVVVFNGEIYNFADIRAELESSGHAFVGRSDTEVILHAFREWGSDAVKRFIGMFAIAIWDEQQQTLELVRDRVGVKPLYFGWDGHSFCFASELKALTAFTHWKPEVDLRSLGEYLQYGYISADRSIFKGVHKLLPGHRLRLTRGCPPLVEPYWSLESLINTPVRGTDEEIEAELESLLLSAFRYRMVSDVPVGVYLSGGVDSSLVTALLAKYHDQPIRTFTIGFREDTHDESRWARNVAAFCGTQHTEHILGASEALEIARDWGALFDEPFGDSSGIPTLLVSRLARNDVKVVLSADGGDELFSGYTVYDTVLGRLAAIGWIPGQLRQASGALLEAFAPPRIASGRFPGLPRLGRLVGTVGGKMNRLAALLTARTPGVMMDAYASYLYPDEISRLLGDYTSPRLNESSGARAPIDQLSLRDFHHYLPEDILTKVDRTTMAVSLEGREPLLDHRLVEYALRLPQHLRRGELGPKHILKRILYRHVPRELVDRPKQGFGIPLENWLRDELKTLVDDYLASDRIKKAGLMDPALVRGFIRSFEAGNRTLTTPIWLLLAFELWRERWL